MLLDIEQDDGSRSRQQEGGGTTIEDLASLGRKLDCLGQGVVKVSNFDRLPEIDCKLVEHSNPDD